MTSQVMVREVATGLFFPEGPIALNDGRLLFVEIARRTLSVLTARGRVEVIATLGGGPNGAAIGPDGHCYVCNNGGIRFIQDSNGGLRTAGQPDDYSGGRIERVNLVTGKAEVIYEAVGRHRLRAPNDIVFDRHGGFWFTDVGKVRARDLDRGGVYYAKPDGSSINEVLYGMHGPNGIGLSADENHLFVAETPTGQLWEFELDGPGVIRRGNSLAPNGGRFLSGPSVYRRFDSLAVDAAGRICVATLEAGGITVVDRNGRTEFIAMPDPYPTNICFGGPSLRTAYITLSRSGRIVSMEWPNGGQPLNFIDRVR
jgi:gluconolactonase